MPLTMAMARITNQGFSTVKKASMSLWRLRSSSAWVHKTRVGEAQVAELLHDGRADQALMVLSEKDNPVERERERENKNRVVTGEG
jgi:enterochelin esterase-like enzyme